MIYSGEVEAEERLKQWVSAAGSELDPNAKTPPPENRRRARVPDSDSPEPGPSNKGTRTVIFIPSSEASPGPARSNNGPEGVAPAAVGGGNKEGGGQDGGNEENELVREDLEKRVERWEQRKESLFHRFERMERRILLDWEEAARWIRPGRAAADWHQGKMEEVLRSVRGMRQEMEEVIGEVERRG